MQIPRNGVPSATTRRVSPCDERGLPERRDGRGGGADAREHDAVDGVETGVVAHQLCCDPEPREGIEHARRVARAVVDDADHGRRSLRSVTGRYPIDAGPSGGVQDREGVARRADHAVGVIPVRDGEHLGARSGRRTRAVAGRGQRPGPPRRRSSPRPPARRRVASSRPGRRTGRPARWPPPVARPARTRPGDPRARRSGSSSACARRSTRTRRRRRPGRSTPSPSARSSAAPRAAGTSP